MPSRANPPGSSVGAAGLISLLDSLSVKIAGSYGAHKWTGWAPMGSNFCARPSVESQNRSGLPWCAPCPKSDLLDRVSKPRPLCFLPLLRGLIYTEYLVDVDFWVWLCSTVLPGYCRCLFILFFVFFLLFLSIFFSFSCCDLIYCMYNYGLASCVESADPRITVQNV